MWEFSQIFSIFAVRGQWKEGVYSAVTTYHLSHRNQQHNLQSRETGTLFRHATDARTGQGSIWLPGRTVGSGKSKIVPEWGRQDWPLKSMIRGPSGVRRSHASTLSETVVPLLITN